MLNDFCEKLMSAWRARFKFGLEYLSGYRVWLEKSSDIDHVRRLINLLAPVGIEQSMIRIGGDGDGGYLLPDDLVGVAAVVSPGVSVEVGFDLAMADRGIQVLMADASVNGPPIDNAHFHFHSKFVDVFEDDKTIRLDSLCSSQDFDEKKDMILQMDIEGAEYRTLLDLSDPMLQRFRIMVIEFHGLDRMFAQFPFAIIQATFQKLLRYHVVVHIHPNNCTKPRKRGDLEIPPVMEFTFYRKDRAKAQLNPALQFPHLLDRDNVAKNPHISLPRCWQSF